MEEELMNTQSEEKEPEPVAWAQELKNHLKRFDQKLYRELKQAGELDSHCMRQAKAAARASDHLVSLGVPRFEADRVAKAQRIYPGSDPSEIG
jgi:hypothetical protein